MPIVEQEQALRAPKTLRVHSPSFADARPIPREHTAFGEDVSPEVSWEGLPAGAKAIALVVDDPDAPGGTFTHWTVWDLPATLRELPAGADVRAHGGIEGRNDFGFATYMGPKPPGGTHRYLLRVFALRERLGLEEDAPAERVWGALAPRVLAWGETMGTFTRPR